MSNRPGYKHTQIGWIPEEWEVFPVGKAFNICNNLRYPISEEVRRKMPGSYPYYGPTKIQDFINEYRVDGKYALIGEDGDHFLKWKELPMTLLIDGKFNVNNHAHLIQGNGGSITEWFYYYFNHRELTPYLTRQGAGRYKLTKEALSKIPIPLPPLAEQLKITEVLLACDKAINTTQAIIEQLAHRNKGLMQKLICDENSEVHLLLSDVFREKSVLALSRANDFEVLSVTKNGLVSQKEYFNKMVASDDRTKYKHVRKGDVVVSGLNFWMGSIDMVNDFEDGIVSPAYKVYELNSTKVSVSYFKHFVRSKLMLKILVSCSITGASIVRRNFDKEMFENWLLKLPSIEMQNKIAEVLDRAVVELKVYEETLLHLKQQKKGLMQILLTGDVRIKSNK